MLKHYLNKTIRNFMSVSFEISILQQMILIKKIKFILFELEKCEKDVKLSKSFYAGLK